MLFAPFGRRCVGMAAESLIENAVIGIPHALRRAGYGYIGVFKILRRRVYFCRGKNIAALRTERDKYPWERNLL